MKNFTPNFPSYPSGHATFGAAAFHITRMFYGTAAGNTKPDTLLDELEFVSEELNGGNRDNQGTVRPRHVRTFKEGSWSMIIENALSRIALGVHWSYDAFALKNANLKLPLEDLKPDLTKNIGGVALGLAIAKDIFAFGSGKAPKMSTAAPTIPTPDQNTVGMPTVPIQPASVDKCIDYDPTKKAAGVEADDKEMVRHTYPSGISPR